MIQQHQPPPEGLAHARIGVRRLLFFFVVCLLGVSALFSLVAGFLLWALATRVRDRREFWRWIVVVAGVSGGVYVAILWLASPFPWLWQSVTYAVAWHLWRRLVDDVWSVWLFNVWLAPACALVFSIFDPRRKLVSLVRDVPAFEDEREQRDVEARALVAFGDMLAGGERPCETSSLSALTQAVPAFVQGQSRLEALGVYEGGELAEWVYDGQLCLLPELLGLHGVVIGEPRFGKTTTLMRLVLIARRYGRKVIYVDLKGSQKTASLFLAVMSTLGVRQVKMYPYEAYDGWRGDSQALFNRLMEQIDPSTHSFYREGVGATLVSLAVKAPGGPPKNSYEFLERLDARWLRRMYASDAQALREIRAIDSYIGGVALVYAGFFRGVAGGLDGQWAFEDADACYIGIDGTTNKEEAASLGRYLLEDAAHYATVRKLPEDQALLIIDEFGVLRSTNATDLYERVREAGLSVYASAQSYQSLGQERDHVLAASATKILHRCGYPDALVKYAGERDRPAFSRLVSQSGGADLLTLANSVQDVDEWHKSSAVVRQQKEKAVRIEEVQQLPVGKVAVIGGGRGAFVQVSPLVLPQMVLQAAQRFLASVPPFAPLAPPSPVLPGQQGGRTQRQRRSQPAGGSTPSVSAFPLIGQGPAGKSIHPASVPGSGPGSGDTVDFFR